MKPAMNPAPTPTELAESLALILANRPARHMDACELVRQIHAQAERLAGALKLHDAFESAEVAATVAMTDRGISDGELEDLQAIADRAHAQFTKAKTEALAAWKEGR